MDTTGKIKIDSNVPLQDWAKSGYETVPLNQTNNQIQLNQPQPIPAPNQNMAITPASLQSVPQLKLPTVQQPTVSAGVIASTQPQTSPSFDTAATNYDTAKAYSGNGADNEQKLLNDLAKSLYGQKASAQANQVNIENQLGIQEQVKASNEINTEIATQQNSLRGEQDRIRNTFGTTAQKQSALNSLNDTYGRRLADLAIRQSAANSNITAIQSNAERQTKLLTAPLDTQLEYLTTFGKDNVNYLSSKEKEKLGFIMDDIKSQKASIEALQAAKAKAIEEVANNGGGTDQAVIKAIQDAKDVTAVAQGASKYLGLLDRQKMAFDQSMQRASLGIQQANLAINRAELDMKLNAGKPIDVSQVVNNPNIPPAAKNSAVITALAGNPKIADGTKTQIANALAVSNALQDFASLTPDGNFEGLGKFALAGRIPGYTTQASVDNSSYLKAIELKTQVWASGASLTAEQTKYVKDLIPQDNDRDAVIAQKTNALANFMNDQVKSQFQSQGVQFKPEKVDLFLYAKASPEQKALLEAEKNK